MSRSHQVVRTERGGLAMLDRDSGEVMHPIVGALSEAESLYVAQSQLARRLQSGSGSFTLFDVGLGAGTNAALAWRVSEARAEPARRLEIVSFDRTAAALELALEPDHARDFGLDGAAGDAARALLRNGQHETAVTRWRLILGELPDTLREAVAPAELVFWDPFSSKTNPGLWSVAAFSAMHAMCAPDATLFTYSSATAVRSALVLAGFHVGEGLSTGAGRPTTAAARRRCDLERPLDQRFLDRLIRSSLPFPTDAPPDALARIRDSFALGER